MGTTTETHGGHYSRPDIMKTQKAIQHLVSAVVTEWLETRTNCDSR